MTDPSQSGVTPVLSHEKPVDSALNDTSAQATLESAAAALNSPTPMPPVTPAPTTAPSTPPEPQPQPLPTPSTPVITSSPSTPPPSVAPISPSTTTLPTVSNNTLPPDAEQKLHAILGKTNASSGSKKPLLISLGVIVLFVLIGVGALLFMRQTKQPETQIAIEPTPTSAPVVAKPVKLFVQLDTFSGKTWSVDNEVLIKGKTTPNTAVMIYSDTDEASVDSDSTGAFEATVMVSENGLVRATAFNEDGDEAHATLSLTEGKVQGIKDTNTKNNKAVEATTKDKKTTQENKNGATQELTLEASKAAKPASAKQEMAETVNTFVTTTTKVEKPAKKGVVVLKKLISAESTASGSISKSTPATVKQLTVKTATAGATLKRHAIMGVISEIGENRMVIQHQVQTTRKSTIYHNLNTVIAQKNGSGGVALQIGMRIAAVGEPVTGGLLATRIHVIPGKAVGVTTKPSPKTATTSATLKPTAKPTTTPTASASATPRTSPTASASAAPTN